MLLYIAFSGLYGQRTSTFELWDDPNGFQRTNYQSEISGLVSTISDSLPVLYTGDFKVYDAGIYLLASRFKDNYVQKSVEDFVTMANDLNTPYLLIIRELSEADGIYGRVHVRLKLPQDYYTINENASIQYLLEDFFNTNLLNQKHFRLAYAEVLNLFKSKIGPGRTVFSLNGQIALTQAGFSRHPADLDIKFVADTSHGTVGLIEDFSRLKLKYFNGNSEDSFLRNSAQSFCESDTKVIFTSEFSTQQDLTNAQSLFENFSESFDVKTIVWIHVFREEEINGNTPWSGAFYFKVKTSLTAEELFQSGEADVKRFREGNAGKRNEICGNINTWRTNPCFFDEFPNVDKTFMLGMLSGLIDGGLNTVTDIIMIIEGTYNAATNATFWNYTKSLIKFAVAFNLKDYSILDNNDIKIISEVFNSMNMVKDFILGLYDFFTEIINKDLILSLAGAVYNTILEMIGEIVNFTFEGGHIVGGILFEIVINFFTAGSGNVAKLGSKGLTEIFSKLKNPSEISDLIRKSWKKGGFKELKCTILGKGCFIKNTPVLMAGNSIGRSGKTYAMAAAMPFAMMPVDEVPLLSYALAHKSVNPGYTIAGSAGAETASNDDGIYMGLINVYTESYRSGDPYTSAEQKQRDLCEINDTDWHSVRFEQVGGTSVCHLALHSDWIKSRNYAVDAIVDMNLPEQGISGPFRITSIKHILPQKKPESDPGDDYAWRPVTGLFTHVSADVHTIKFSNNESIGVTAPHPIFSTTYNDWRLAGALEVGEQVLTYHGEATVASNEKKSGSEVVYNLEVKDLHNFLVGDAGVVVHNSCWREYLDLFFKASIGKWVRKKVTGKQWVDYIEESGLPDVGEIQQLENLGSKLQKRMIGLNKSKVNNTPFPGIDGLIDGGNPLSLKTSVSGKEGERLREMVNKANNLNDGLVTDHADWKGTINKIDGMMSAKQSTKSYIQARWQAALNDSSVKTEIIENLYIEAKDGWMKWSKSTGQWTSF